ncbi:MAG: hypothetical protein JWM82_2882 [Myxococcales bacterium]|nr:hypothetical protein [Myxococcales bacterium]
MSPEAEAILTTRLPEVAASWFKQALHEVRACGEPTDAFLILWTGAGRRLGQTPIGSPTPEESRAAFFPAGWPADEYGRALLLQAVLDARLPEVHAALVHELFMTGDLRERRAVLRALSFLEPEPARFLTTGVEAMRNNALPVIEAIACENPYPARFFSEEAFNQLVLKCLFCEISLARVEGLATRLTPELRRMAAGYATERRAAGRPVPHDIALVVGGEGEGEGDVDGLEGET